MAMRVNGDPSRLVIESKRVPVPLEKVVNDDFSKRKQRPRDALGPGSFSSGNLDEHRSNMMPREKGRRFGLSRVQEIEGYAAHFCCGFQIP